MVHWLKVANRSLARSNNFVPAFGHTLTCSPRRIPVLNSVVRDQRSLSPGAATSAKLSVSRRLLFGSVVLAAGAIAAWNVRKQKVDLHADVQGRTGQYGNSQPTQTSALRSSEKAGKREFRSLFATMNSRHADLINSLRKTERLTDKTAYAMMQVDRKFFLDPDNQSLMHLAYEDHPVPIGYGETISAPHMHAEALRLLEDHCPPGASVLDVGSGDWLPVTLDGHIILKVKKSRLQGSGYLTGCLGVMVGDSGQVLGVEKHKELAQRSMQSLQQAVPELMRKDTIKIMPGNVLGKVLGQYGPFDAIHVGAAAATMPQNLTQKLKPGGRMVIPVGAQNSLQVLKLVDKDKDGNVHETDLMGVAFVPLTEPGTDPFVGKDED